MKVKDITKVKGRHQADEELFEVRESEKMVMKNLPDLEGIGDELIIRMIRKGLLEVKVTKLGKEYL